LPKAKLEGREWKVESRKKAEKHSTSSGVASQTVSLPGLLSTLYFLILLAKNVLRIEETAIYFYMVLLLIFGFSQPPLPIVKNRDA
jgi:hypothetical protein